MRWRFWRSDAPPPPPFSWAREVEHPRARFLVQNGRPETLVAYAPIRVVSDDQQLKERPA